MTNLDRLNEEAYRLSEKRLDVQLTTALAADARAMAFAGICLAAAAVLGGLAEDSASPVLMLTGASLFGVAALFAGYSARPVDFHMSGARFSDLQEDIDKDQGYNAVIRQMGGFLDNQIDKNDQILNGNSKLFLRSFVISIIGVALAVVPQLLLVICVESEARLCTFMTSFN